MAAGLLPEDLLLVAADLVLVPADGLEELFFVGVSLAFAGATAEAVADFAGVGGASQSHGRSAGHGVDCAGAVVSGVVGGGTAGTDVGGTDAGGTGVGFADSLGPVG